VVTVCTARFNIQKFYRLPTQCIYVFCVGLRTNNYYFPVQHWLTGIYNRDGVCLLRGTGWIYMIQVNPSLERVNKNISLINGKYTGICAVETSQFPAGYL
jgi:hypothetical protein